MFCINLFFPEEILPHGDNSFSICTLTLPIYLTLIALRTVPAISTMKHHSQLQAHSRHFIHPHLLTCFPGFKDRGLPDNLLELMRKYMRQWKKNKYMTIQFIMIHLHPSAQCFLTRLLNLQVSFQVLTIFFKALNYKGPQSINWHLAKVFSSSCISDFMGLLPTYCPK